PGGVPGAIAPEAPRLPGNIPFPPPVSPMPGFSASPFTPQPQPFPFPPPATAPAQAAPNPEENPASTVPTPP
ncbi:MAG TPA: protein translocase subunit SecD, partial [Vicinamibacteria bacterium]